MTSTRVIFACAYGLRTIDAHTIPVMVRSSMNLDWPVRSFASSLRGTDLPM